MSKQAKALAVWPGWVNAAGEGNTAVHDQLVALLQDSHIALRGDIEQYVTNMLNGVEE